MKVEKTTPLKEITIAALQFKIPEPFVAGHVCLENEAHVLNQILAENIRNNFKPAVEKAKKEANGAPPDMKKLQTELTAYIAEYEFSRAGGGFRPRDPVEREALLIAISKVQASAKKQGKKIENKEELESLAQEVLAKYPQVREMAKKVVAMREEAARV